MRSHCLRILDAALLASVVLVMADALTEIASNRLGLATFLFGLGSVTTLALACAAAICGVAWIAPRIDVAIRRTWFVPLVAAVVACMPLLQVLVRLVQDPGIGLAIVLGTTGVVFYCARRLAHRAQSPAGWLAASIVAEQIVFRTAESVGLADRIDPARAGLPLALLCGSSLAGVALAELIRDLLAIELQRTTWRVVVSVVAGGALLATALIVFPDLYRAAHRSAYLAAFLLLASGFARFRIGGGGWPRAALGTVAIASVAWLAFILRLPSETPWQLSSATHIAREVVAETGLLKRPFQRFVASLRERPERPETARPNRSTGRSPPVATHLLLITIDSLRWDHVNWSGRAAQNLTPSMDLLARQSIRFRRAYTQGAWTSLALPALFWSRYPKDIKFTPIFQDSELRLWFPGEVPPGVVIREMFQTPRDEPAFNLAEVLSAEDFETVAVPNDGPTRFLEPRIGIVRGFSRVLHPRTLLGLASHSRVASPDSVVADIAIRALDSLGTRPFFLWVHFYDPHGPHIAPAGAIRTGYAGEIESTDAQVGRLLEALRMSGLDERTMVVLTSDHGELLSTTNPVIGVHGIDVREALVHVPLLVRVPGAAPRDIEDVVSLLDLAPTMLAAVGVDAPLTMAGRVLGPHWRGEGMPARPAFLETWYYEAGTGVRMLHQIGAVEGAAKVVIDLRSSGIAFFNVEDDPREERNLFVAPLASTHLDLAAALVRWYGL